MPKNDWFSRTLLYWDEIGAIVPYEYFEQPEELGPYMQDLLQEELVIPINPGAYLWQLSNFAKAFTNHLELNPIKSLAPKYLWVKVHMEKLQELGKELCEKGLASKDEKHEYSSWYLVEPTVADKFMTYLAVVLGQMQEDKKFYPITENPSNFDYFLQGYEPEDLVPIRRQLLEKVLPAPSGNIEPATIAEFKDKYRGELSRYRRLIEEKASELSIIKDKNDRDYRTEQVGTMLREEVKELESRMKEEKKWPRISLGNFCILGGSSISACKAIIDKDYRFGLAAATLSMLPAVISAFKGSNIVLDDKPLAYAALAGNEFI